ncbi:MAG: tyrosine-type recombinase/integrase [Lysinibacillus sp.]
MSIKPKVNKCQRDKELFWYLDAEGNKCWLYRHRYYDVLGKRKEKKQQGFTNEAAAYRGLCEVRAKLVTGNNIEVENGNMKVSEWMDIWFESNKNAWRENTVKQRKSMIRDQFKPLLGKYKLSSLDKETYKREFIQKLEKQKYKASTIRLFHRVFKVAINAAVDNEFLPRNRFTKVVIKDDESKNVVTVITKSELQKVLSYASENETITVSTLFHFLAYSGCRRGEAFGLQWRDIDFINNRVTFDRQRNSDKVGPLKTKNSYRTIDMDPEIIQMLKKYQNWCKQLLLADGQKISDKDFVFLSYQTKEPFADNSLHYAFHRVKDRTGITSPFTPHVFRHTHATLLLLSAKVDVTVVADRLGNTPKVVWETYAHVLEEAKLEVIEIFSTAVKLQVKI